MIYNYLQNEDQPADNAENVPNYEQEILNAKFFLQKTSNVSGDNLYDHLTECLNKILAERPENVIDYFEEFSRKMKERRFLPVDDHLEDIYIPPGRYNLVTKSVPLLRPIKPDEPSTVDPDDLELADMRRNNMLELLHYFEQAGFALPRPNMFFTTLAMKAMVQKLPISSIRLWGVVYGVFRNYIIIEGELKEEELMKRNEILLKEEQVLQPVVDETILEQQQQFVNALENLQKEQEIGGEGKPTKYPRSLPPEPRNIFELPVDAPVEPSGVGVNKKVYYVCNEIGDEWIELPDVTPQQIKVARQIYKSFTGFLDREVLTYPEFPGTERNYLRAQIARISAGTDISPLGYFTFAADDAGEAEEEEDEEAEAGGMPKTVYRLNNKYTPPLLDDLIDKSMSFWVHHTLYILPQGRTSWWNPNPLPSQGEDVDEEMGEEEAEEKRPMGPEPEIGPPLLTPCSEDAALETVPAWSVRPSSECMREYALAVIRSNLWPGASSFSTQGKLFQNIYLGYGLKYQEHNFSPVPLAAVQQDYPIGPEIMEMTDPTGAQEEEWRIAHLPKPIELKIIGEGGEEEDFGEEDEDEDEDDD